jgi:VCBS repeat protein
VLRAEESDRGGRRRHERLKLLDLDGDGRTELVLTRSQGRGSGGDHQFIAVRRAPDGTPEESPSALVKLSGMDVDYTTVDVDHDGLLDLVANRIDVPTGLTSLANIRLDTGTYVFHGEKGATFDRDAIVKLERTFRPEQLARVQETLVTNFGGDFDGDGLNDLVLTQIDGRVEIRRLRKSDGFFSLDDKAFASFVPPAPVELLETWDLSHDGVADLVLRHKHSFTMFVSVPGSVPAKGTAPAGGGDQGSKSEARR